MAGDGVHSHFSLYVTVFTGNYRARGSFGVAALDDDTSKRGGVRSYALDPARARALWAKSEEMVGERF